MKILESLNKNGFVIIPQVLNSQSIQQLRQIVTPLIETYPTAGIRDIVQKSSPIQKLALSEPILKLVQLVLSHPIQLVRSVLFNKTHQINWKVTWHQDLSIAVSQKQALAGYTNWSEKEGIPHVQPPLSLLEQMITVRIHLDETNEYNGCLSVSPSSHQMGRIPTDQAAIIAKQNGIYHCQMQAGDVLIFKPLLLHASKKMLNPTLRRIIHLEYTSAHLPQPLKWAYSNML